MKKIYIIVIGFPIILATQGCAPVFRPSIPKVTGKVLDKQNHNPVFDAQISLQIEGEAEVLTTSNESGKFYIKNKSTLTLAPLFLQWGFIPPHGDLVVSAKGYYDFNKEVYGEAFEITIELEPADAR